jgi:integrase
MRLTNRQIDALKPKSSRYEVWDGSGFGVRVTPRGTKSFIWVYHHEGRPRRMTLGSYPKMTLADGRLRLAEARKILERGEDPGAKNVAARRAEKQAESVAKLAERYLELWARPRKRSAAEDERILRSDILPAWGRRKARTITRRDVVALLDSIVERGSPIAANRTLALIRRMFNWAVERDMIETSPCVGVRAPSAERQRDRVLTGDEIRTFWRAMNGREDAREDSTGNEPRRIRMSDGIRHALKFQLVTAQRKGEIVGAEWDEFDLSDRVWTIPADKAKNGFAHRIPLSPLAMELLEKIKAAAGDSRWLFPSRRGDKSITPLAVNHALRNNRAALGIEDITPHDLRRTAASGMTSIGFSRLVVSKILNHAESGVTAVYDRHSYDTEKRQALDAWAEKLSENSAVTLYD